MSSLWRYPYALLGIVFVLIGFALWPRHTVIPVLIYHDIASSTVASDSYAVEATLLSREIEYLITEGYTPLTFSVASTLMENKRLPAHPIILTFDDALPGHIRNALPILITHNVAATFFITSDLIGDNAHLNWTEVRAIAEAGMEIGGHTAHHVHTLELNATDLTSEIIGDKQHIENEIGKPITVFAYPFQEHNARADEVVSQAGYTIVRDTAPFRSTVMTNSFNAFLKAL